MRCMRILPELWARTSCPLSVFTRNVAFFNDSTTVPSSRIACSLALALDSVLYLLGDNRARWPIVLQDAMYLVQTVYRSPSAVTGRAHHPAPSAPTSVPGPQHFRA